MKMVEKWWKAWSSQLLVVAIAVAELHPYLLDAMQILPQDWYRVAFAAILIARIVKQRSMVPPQ